MSFLTCFWLFPQKEHFSRSPPSPIRATGGHPPVVELCAVERFSMSFGSHPTVPRATPGWGWDTRNGGGAEAGSAGHGRRALEGLEDGVDQAVLDRTLGGQDLVALDVAADLLEV